MYLDFQNQFTQPSEKEEAPKTSTASLLLGTYNEVCAVFFMVDRFKYWLELFFAFLLIMLVDHTLHLLQFRDGISLLAIMLPVQKVQV